jgi:hypothetical protein
MMYIKILLIMFLFASQQCFSQDSSTILIKVPDYDLNFYPGRCDSTYKFSLSNKKYLIIKLINCTGEMDVECFNFQSKLLEKGKYTGSLDLLKTYRTKLNATSQKKQTVVVSYYQPLRNGPWYFYTEKGKLIRIIEYNTGEPN